MERPEHVMDRLVMSDQGSACHKRHVTDFALQGVVCEAATVRVNSALSPGEIEGLTRQSEQTW